MWMVASADKVFLGSLLGFWVYCYSAVHLLLWIRLPAGEKERKETETKVGREREGKKMIVANDESLGSPETSFT